MSSDSESYPSPPQATQSLDMCLSSGSIGGIDENTEKINNRSRTHNHEEELQRSEQVPLQVGLDPPALRLLDNQMNYSLKMELDGVGDEVDSIHQRNSVRDDSPQKEISRNNSQRMPVHASFVTPPTEPPTFRMSDNWIPSPTKKNVATPTKLNPGLQSSAESSDGTGRAVIPGAIPVSGSHSSPLKQERGRRSATSGSGNEKVVMYSYAIGANPIPAVVGAVASKDPPSNKSDERSVGLRLAAAEDTLVGTDQFSCGSDGVIVSSFNQSDSASVGLSIESTFQPPTEEKADPALSTTSPRNYAINFKASPSKSENLHLATGQAAVTAYAPCEEGFPPKISSYSTGAEKEDHAVLKTSHQFSHSTIRGSQLKQVGAHRVDGLEHITTVNGKASPSKSENLNLATGQAAVTSYAACQEDDGSPQISTTYSSIASSICRPGARTSFSRPKAFRASSPVRNTSSQPYGNHQQEPSSATNRPAEVADAEEVARHFEEAEIRAMAAVAEQSTITRDKPEVSFFKRRRCTIIAVVFVVTAAIGAAIVALKVGGGDAKTSPLSSPDDTVSPSMEPTEYSELDPIKVEATGLYIVDHVSSSVDLYTAGSPQNLAWLWLVSKDQIVAFSSNMTQDGIHKMRARYILAVFYFALGGVDWKYARNWLDGTVDECDWEFVTCDEASYEILQILTSSTIGGNPLEGSNNMIGGLPTELIHLDTLGKIQRLVRW
jgi:hypothetical protein